MSTEQYLGMIVGYRRVLKQNYAQDELKKEERAKQLAAAFAKTDIENIWLAAQDIMIPHFDSEKRLAGIEIRLGDCGKLIRRRGLPNGLRIDDGLYGGPLWCCKREGDSITYHMHQPIMYDSTRFTYHGHVNPKNIEYTAKDMRDSFLSFMTIAIPTQALSGIEPIDMAEVDAKKTRRKIMAPA